MPKYLVEFSYTLEGARGFMKEGGSSRREATKKLVESMGGKLEAYYFAFGEWDGFALVDAPDNVSVVAVNMTVGSSGAVRTKTTVLITPEEADAAMKLKPSYRPPGQ